ncbi:MAG: hypothetical protein CVU46_03435 [Chloroflexi bacterium HGW-Chloroflexi-8]|jgi:virulence factor|nr:MAG: hypothetical protein CVU46_03435 [Chloroflexi bacterium HGW-Chloroflexi-8]
MTKRKIAIIGLGDISQKAYLPVLATDPSLDVILYNRSESALDRVQNQYHLEKGFTSMDEALEENPEAAFVLTSSETHFEIIQKLLSVGIDVFTEKPATLHSNETRTLTELAEREDRILMVGFNRRFAPIHIRAREIWADHPVSMAFFNKFRTKAFHKDLRSQLMDDTIHQIDLLRFFCGEGHAVSTRYVEQDEHLQSVVSVIQLDNGGIGIVSTNLQAGAWQENYALYGGQQTLEIDAFSQIRFIQSGVKSIQDETYASTWKTTLEGRGFVNQIQHFFNCLDSRSQPLTNGHEALKTQLLLEEILEKAID